MLFVVYSELYRYIVTRTADIIQKAEFGNHSKSQMTAGTLSSIEPSVTTC